MLDVLRSDKTWYIETTFKVVHAAAVRARVCQMRRMYEARSSVLRAYVATMEAGQQDSLETGEIWCLDIAPTK